MNEVCSSLHDPSLSSIATNIVEKVGCVSFKVKTKASRPTQIFRSPPKLREKKEKQKPKIKEAIRKTVLRWVPKKPSPIIDLNT